MAGSGQTDPERRIGSVKDIGQKCPAELAYAIWDEFDAASFDTHIMTGLFLFRIQNCCCKGTHLTVGVKSY